MTTVFVVIEWEGNGQTIDGATIRGVFRSYEAAAHEAESLRASSLLLVEDIEIQEHTLR